MKIRRFLAFMICAFATLAATQPGQMLFDRGPGEHIVVNNRVLANANGKAITVIDVQKSMDLHFYQQYPEYAKVAEARFQFYQMNWRRTLDELINKELIMADAEENKLPVTSGDIRQELEGMFGPNVISNLDIAKLTFHEAWELVKSDLILRRMMFFRVNNKAQKQVTPQKIREAYVEFAEKNWQPAEWHYYVISVRGEDVNANEEVAKKAHALLTDQNVPLDDLQAAFEKEGMLPESTKLTVSKRYEQKENEVSENYRKQLQDLHQGEISSPVAQESRASNAPVYRLFFLEELVAGGTKPFPEVETQLENALMNEAVGVETGHYIAKLRDHYHIHQDELDALIPAGFQPFNLR